MFHSFTTGIITIQNAKGKEQGYITRIKYLKG